MNKFKLSALAAVITLACSMSLFSETKEKIGSMSQSDNPHVKVETSLGNFTLELFPSEAPATVTNFIGLAKGTKDFTDPKTGSLTKRPFYDGLIFHRVIPKFMIQGGDPRGDGTGGPGYQFQNEVAASRSFDRPGMLAMANAGPNTNGSQFFVTVAATPWLTKEAYTIFGQVIEGYEVVEKISKVERNANDRPLTPVVIKSVTVMEKGAKK